MLISNVLFETHNVSLFIVPPGEALLRCWNPSEIIWKGSLRVTEEEQTSASDLEPWQALRLKLEFYNEKSTDDYTLEASDRKPWAEVWYNPFADSGLDYKLGNDGLDTITMSQELSKHYRVVAQPPGSGYCPIPLLEKGLAQQVALGLQLPDLLAAADFSDALAIYKRHFRNFQEKLFYDQHLVELQQKVKVNLAFPAAPLDLPADDDDFGSFVGASYD